MQKKYAEFFGWHERAKEMCDVWCVMWCRVYAFASINFISMYLHTHTHKHMLICVLRQAGQPRNC